MESEKCGAGNASSSITTDRKEQCVARTALENIKTNEVRT